jgi:hypothetical protein
LVAGSLTPQLARQLALYYSSLPCCRPGAQGAPLETKRTSTDQIDRRTAPMTFKSSKIEPGQPRD